MLAGPGENGCAAGRPRRRPHTKMVNQVLIATNMIGVCEALLYGYRAGLDLETAWIGRLRRRGKLVALESRPADPGRKLRPRILRRALHKDMGIALGEARRMGLVLPGLALAKQFVFGPRAGTAATAPTP